MSPTRSEGSGDGGWKDERLSRALALSTWCGARAHGRTRHTIGNKPAPLPVELQIVQFEGEDGYYLFYCDEKGREFTDTHHDSIQRAMEQAEWEFG